MSIGQNFVSIIMPTYNCADYIGGSIESVLNQTHKNWELLIIDDCSTDNTKEVVEQYAQKDSRIKYYCLEKNSGPAGARNWGLKQTANSDYVAFLDSDDLWMPAKLEKQLDFMSGKNGKISHFSCTGYNKIDENGNPLDIELYPPKSSDYWKLYFLADPIGNSTVMYDRHYYGVLSVPNIRKRNDFALWLKMLKNGGTCEGMRECLASYTVRSDSVSAKKMKLVKYQWELYRNVEKLNLFICILGISSWALVKSTKFGFAKFNKFLR